MSVLKDQKCKPCSGNEEPLKGEKLKNYTSQLKNDWQVIESEKIKRSFPFNNFTESMDFAQKIADVANEQDHHPDLGIHYKSVDVELTTHAIGGLSENDFIMAAKIDEL